MAPLEFLRQLRNHFTKGPEPLPPLSTNYVAGLSIAFTIIYVLPFYLFSTTRPSPTISRDSPTVIKARIQLVTVSCGICMLITVYVLAQLVRASRFDILRLLGWWPIGLAETFQPLLLTAILFLGPLFEKAVVESQWREWITLRPLRQTLASWIGWRNFVAGPITEEFVFRSLLTSLALLTPLTPKQAVFLTPLYFGLAHVHHFYEFRLTHPRVPWLPALAQSLFQFAYTTLFGWYANFVFVRTGSLPAVILAHVFCNWIGLPRLWGRVEAGAVIGPTLEHVAGDDDRNRPDDAKGFTAKAVRATQVADGQLHVLWTLSYYVLLVLGAGLFVRLLFPLTASPCRLAELR